MLTEDLGPGSRRWVWPAGDGHGEEWLSARWEGGGWTVEGHLDDDDVDYVVRLDADGDVRQFMLFRDLDEPDLWLAHDGRGSWGEVNGAVRDDLRGCRHIGLRRSRALGALALIEIESTTAGPPHRPSNAAHRLVAVVDGETLGIGVALHAVASDDLDVRLVSIDTQSPTDTPRLHLPPPPLGA